MSMKLNLPKERIDLKYYRSAGKFLWFKVKERCRECDATYVILQQLVTDTFRDKPVFLEIKPWLDNWWRIIWRGGWRAPIVMINGRVFSQGAVPDVPRLVKTIGAFLADEELQRAAEELGGRQPPPRENADVIVYVSPACPHCNHLLGYLDVNGIQYSRRDVSKSHTAREEVKELTGKLAIPVIKTRDSVLEGFDRKRVREFFDIDPSQEPEGKAPRKEERPVIDPVRVARTLEAAKALLVNNQVDGRTKASARLYPHQWNWDAGFIARGYLHFDPEQAYSDIRSLFEGQWSNGFLPHIIFAREHAEHFPGPRYWRTECSGQVPVGVHTSGISQPPVHASMLVDALDLDSDRDRAVAFLTELYPKMKASHDFFFEHRDPEGEGLVFLVHPWESGMDNAPIWDDPLSRIEGSTPWARNMQRTHDKLAEKGLRPKRSYIEKYSYLVGKLHENAYQWEAIAGSHPFRVQDVLFNAILCKAEEDLGKIAIAIGQDPAPHDQRAKRVADAMNRKLWHEPEGLYYSYDLVAERHIERDTVFSYLPLYAGVCDTARAHRLINNLETHCYCLGDRNCVGVPSYDMCQADYEGEFYWRGPVWFNINWYLAQGLRRYGEEEQAEWVENSLLELVAERGFYEYFEPTTGKGLGADGFSWTAALYIDLAAQRFGPRIAAPATSSSSTGQAHIMATP